ncbi:MAG: hypothetical protein GW749_09525 [Alphaproteobacteria bacterium]|nr:hypothetical protein [Alphaproteobacteria bacterium]NCT08112.1 hypothetical protein [Alphaproteobacteria bacterium]
MIKTIQHRLSLLRLWREEKAVAALETAILFPVLISMLMAVYDLGQGVIVNQKTISASQIIADLVTRNEVLNMQLIDDIVIAGEMALRPYNNTNNSFGYDIIGVEFDEDEDPVEIWRVSENMAEGENLINRAEDLGLEGEGVIIVSVVYRYTPFFTNFVVSEFNMQETAVLRGRKSAIVTCEDCPI